MKLSQQMTEDCLQIDSKVINEEILINKVIHFFFFFEYLLIIKDSIIDIHTLAQMKFGKGQKKNVANIDCIHKNYAGL